ncbi:MAG: penicillin-binding protein activator [Rhodospirillaceae bacterium]
MPEPDTTVASDGMTRVALLVPLTGSSAELGEALLNAAQMALFDVGDERLVLQSYDTRGTPDGAREAATQALGQGVQLVIGPLFAASAQAVAPAVRARGVSMVTFSTDPAVAGNGVYVVGFLLREQVRRVVEHARAQGLSRFAALAPDSQYGRLMVQAYTDAVRRMGGTLARVEYYTDDTQQLTQTLQRLGDYDQRKAALERQRTELGARSDAASQEALRRLEGQETAGELPFDALLLPEGGTRAREVAAMLPFYDIDTTQVKLLGPMLWDDPTLAREPAMIGAWYPAPPPETHATFEQRYQRAFGTKPPLIAGLSYDTTALAAVLARQGGSVPFSAENLTNPSGFAGFEGLFRFLSDGTSERGFAVMEIRRGGNVQIGGAPQSFEPSLIGEPGYIEQPRPAL